ncbi:MAG TPA: nuclear transport factor 2 family protein [Terriglobales bacterium]|jgi:ketosteroid isomerase-like protein|nr:nuclear transport factor 2 family protein [Terriglobales bacterium]
MNRPAFDSSPAASSWLDVQSTIRGLTQDFATSFNTANYDQAAVLFASDGFLMSPQQEMVQGPKPIELILRRLGEAGYQNLRMETIRVDHAGDMAVEIGRYTVAIQQANGTTIADRGKFLHVWRRLGAWLMVANSWNSDLPVAK